MGRKPWDHDGRTTTPRGYGWAWQQLRAQVLRDEPLCRACDAKGQVTRATQVDHVKPKTKGGTDDRTNLAPLCEPCHEAKTARDAGKRSKPIVGADGWPID